MYNINAVREKCQQLSAAVGDEFDIPVVLNKRLTRTLGQVVQDQEGEKWYSTSLEISKTFLSVANEEDFKNVIEHEWVHYYLTKVTGKLHGHDAEFKKMCARIGCTHDSKTLATELELPYKYTIHCHSCGKDIGGFSRMCYTLKHLEEYQCEKCGSKDLSYKQNW